MCAAGWALLLVVLGCQAKGDGASDTGAPGTRIVLDPPEGALDTSMAVEMRAEDPEFVFGATEADFGPGIEVEAVTVEDGWTAVADLRIAADADTGVRDVRLVVEDRPIDLPSAFRVVSSSFSIDPDRGRLGETLTVTFAGRDTHWSPGTTWVSFGEGVDVLDFTVVSETEAVAEVAVRQDAAPGTRDVFTQDGDEVVTLYDGFQVDRVGLGASFEPASIEQGASVEFAITGRGTHFDDGTALTFLDGGEPNADITVDSLSVTDPEHLWGRMTASNAAALGMRDVLVTTGDEGVLIADAFEVTPGPVDPEDVAVSLTFYVTRIRDNVTGDLDEFVTAFCWFYVPLDPPCGSPPPSGDGPLPYDINGVFPVPEEPDPEDCPTPRSVSAGDHVWLESQANVVTLDRTVDSATGGVYYLGYDLTMADYVPGQVYDLHLEGDPKGLAEEIVPGVLPTVPGNWTLLSPPLWGNYTHDRTRPFEYTWGLESGGEVVQWGALTYPDAIFVTGIYGSTFVDTGEPAWAGSIPWDDGQHAYQPDELLQLAPADVQFVAYSYIEGPEFGLADSIYQSNVANSYIYEQAYLVLE